jgi:hypothetical protein
MAEARPCFAAPMVPGEHRPNGHEVVNLPFCQFLQFVASIEPAAADRAESALVRRAIHSRESHGGVANPNPPPGPVRALPRTPAPVMATAIRERHRRSIETMFRVRSPDLVGVERHWVLASGGTA